MVSLRIGSPLSYAHELQRDPEVPRGAKTMDTMLASCYEKDLQFS